MKMRFKAAMVVVALSSATAYAQVNVGEQKSQDPPLELTAVANFTFPWRIAFLPDGRMLVTEKSGPVWLVTQSGERTLVVGTPPVYWERQTGMLGVFLSPTYANDQAIYLTYVEPGDYGGGLALARATLAIAGKNGRLQNLEVLWRQLPKGKGGHPGGEVAFSPDGKHLFLSVGDRQRMLPAQDPNYPAGKILRLTLDGKPAPGNPNFDKTGAPSLALTDPPRDTELAKTASVVSTYTVTSTNTTPAETWAIGVRTPYGLAFSPTGELWEVEHGPAGGDELNLIEKGKNYGWPLVSYGKNYNGVDIPSHDTRADLQKPVLYWVPVIAPGNLMFYTADRTFPQWNGNGFISGLGTQSLTRIVFDGKGGAKVADRWNVGRRIRDVKQAPDGSLWLLEDAAVGALLRATPKSAPN